MYWNILTYKQVTLLLDVDISTVIECIDIAIILTVNTWHLLLRLYSGNATKLNTKNSAILDFLLVLTLKILELSLLFIQLTCNM